MAGEMNGVYILGMGTLGALFLLFMGNRVAVPVRKKFQRGMRK
jgi:hypothetical protein